MKKAIGILLAAAMVFQGSLFTAFAADPGVETISKLNIKINTTLSWDGDTPKFKVEFVPDAKGVDVISVEYVDKNNLTAFVSGSDIEVSDGEYQYELTLGTQEGFIFSNELDGIRYQGVDGNYSMNYSFPPGGDKHTMIVKGSFNNIISASPLKIDGGKLLTRVISKDYSGAADFIMDDQSSKNVSIENGKTNKISDDKYSYELVLKTKEGFHFSNNLEFLYNENKYGFTMTYDYSLSDNNKKLTIKGYVEKKQSDSGKAVTSLKPGMSAAAADKFIKNRTSDSDPKGAVYSKLKLRSTSQTKKTINLKWKKLSKARMYVIYGNKCGSKNKMKKLAVLRGNTFSVRLVNRSELKNGAYYKFMIVALDKDAKVVSASKVIHVTKKGGKVGNHKSVTVSKAVLSKAQKLRKGKTLKLKAKAVPQSKKLKVRGHVGVRYESTNKKIATVNKKGVITAKKKGTCYVYAYAQDGVYKRIKVRVK